MKKGLLVTILFCFASANLALFAQQNDQKRKEAFEKLIAERKEFISKAINLTESESKTFWAIEDEFQAKKFELNKTLRSEMRKIRQAKKDGKTVSDAEYKKLVELAASVKVKEAELGEEYTTKFLKILPAEKVYLYLQAEQEFAGKMVNKRQRR
jgi:Spy/CpxP family protein refolding chaperone